MKSIKILAVAVLCTVAFSCKKKEETSEAKNLDSAQAKTVVDALSQQESPAETEMLAEAKSKPLTTVAFSETDHNFGDIKKGEKVEELIH
jgi:hypothetical protein